MVLIPIYVYVRVYVYENFSELKYYVFKNIEFIKFITEFIKFY